MTRSARSSAAVAVRDILRNRAIRRIEIAWTAGTAADWAFLVVLLVVAYDEGGTLAVGILGAVRVLPAIVAAPFATSLVGRFRGDRVLTAINVLRCGGAVATACVVAADLPMEIMFVLAGVVAGAGSLVRPIQNALLPALARTPGELVASNVASSVGEGLGTFAGPLLAGALVASTGSVEASVIVAAVFAGAAAAVTGVRFEGDTDARGGAPAATRPGAHLREIPRMLRRYPAATVIVGDFVAQVFVRGVFIALTVAVSIELLGLGEGGVGMLNAAVGLGGLVGALGSLRLAGGARLGSVFVIALAAWGVPLVVMGAWPVAAVALVGLFVTGISNAILDVSGFTLVQRGVGNEDRVTMFAVMEGLFGVGLLLGSLAAPALDALLGTRGALVVAGSGLAALRAPERPDSQTGLGPRPHVRGAPRAAPEQRALRPPAADRSRPVVRGDDAAGVRAGRGGHAQGRAGRRLRPDRGGTPGGDRRRSHARHARAGRRRGRDRAAPRGPTDGDGHRGNDVVAYTIDAPLFLDAVAGPAAAAAAERLVASRLERSRTA